MGQETGQVDYQAVARRTWIKTRGQPWEPPDPRHPLLGELIARGYIRRTDGRCGFERFKDSMCAWTETAKHLFASVPL